MSNVARLLDRCVAEEVVEHVVVVLGVVVEGDEAADARASSANASACSSVLCPQPMRRVVLVGPVLRVVDQHVDTRRELEPRAPLRVEREPV